MVTAKHIIVLLVLYVLNSICYGQGHSSPLRIKVLNKLEESMIQELKNETTTKNFTHKQQNIKHLLVKYIKLYSTAKTEDRSLDLPESLMAWYDESESMKSSNLGRSSCGLNPTACSPFLPFDGIWNYGCWCYFANNAGKGSGQPIDELDQLCKDLQSCYRCAKIDSLNNNNEEICSPGTQDYKVHIHKTFMSTNTQGILADCHSENSLDDCAANTCCCEMNFVSNLLRLWFSGYQINKPQYNRDNWDAEMCKVIPLPPTVLACCGEYPARVPYSLDRGKVECCNNEILYNLASHKCCSDGSIGNINSSC